MSPSISQSMSPSMSLKPPPHEPDTSLHFWIHLELANNHRLPIMESLARTLCAGGHRVTISCESQLAYHFHEEGEVLSRDAQKSIERHLRQDGPYRTITLDTFAGTSPEAIQNANLLRHKHLVSLFSSENNQPDYVVLWSGNFHYQSGTLAALRDANLTDRTIFTEVAWFPQGEYIYCDSRGVNAKSTIPAEIQDAECSCPLTPQQKAMLSIWRNRFITQRLGHTPPPVTPKRIFVPLQVDTDTSVSLGSPFQTMADFISFLEKWVPEDWDVILKVHPKAKYSYVPVTTRPNFRLVANGSIDEMIARAEFVVGINSTVLLESLALGKKVISFGAGLFSGTKALIEATPDDPFATLCQQEPNAAAQDALLYHLVFQRQISLDALEKGDIAHLASRMPFSQIKGFLPQHLRGKLLTLNAQRGSSMIKVGKSKIAATASLDVEKGGQIIIGDNCEIRHHAVLEVSGRYNGTIEMGDHCVVGVGGWLQGSGKITFGNNVILGPYVAIVSTSHQHEDISTPIAQQSLVTGEVTIEDDVWVGAHVTITQNVRIGAHSIIGANAFVNKDVPPYSVVAGTPAKIIRSRLPEDTQEEKGGKLCAFSS